MREWAGERGGKREVWVRTRSLEVLLDHRFELLKSARFNVELPLQIGAHLSFHLVDLPESEHSLTNDTPGLVGISVIADDLGCNHEC
jgi:hypothetical protein